MSKKNGNPLDQPIKLGNGESLTDSNIKKEYGLIQLKKYDTDKILNLIKRKAQVLKFKEFNISLNKTRLILFKKKGVDCVICGAKGSYFSIDVPYVNKQNAPPHLNLWAINAKGDHVLMTRDHMLPASKGGWNGTFNLMPMCSHCNHKKADKFSKFQYIRHFILKNKFLLIEFLLLKIKKIGKAIVNFSQFLEEYNA